MRELKIDGVEYSQVACNVSRVSELKASENSGMLLNKTYHNDVIGTYLQYTVEVLVPLGEEKTYAQLYETLSDPEKDHLFRFPYNQGTVEFYGRVETISDELLRKINNNTYWRNTKFTCVANTPTKEATIGGIQYHGIEDLPAVTELDNGKIYMVIGGEWEMTSLRNGDEDYY